MPLDASRITILVAQLAKIQEPLPPRLHRRHQWLPRLRLQPPQPHVNRASSKSQESQAAPHVLLVLTLPWLVKPRAACAQLVQRILILARYLLEHVCFVRMARLLQAQASILRSQLSSKRGFCFVSDCDDDDDDNESSPYIKRMNGT